MKEVALPLLLLLLCGWIARLSYGAGTHTHLAKVMVWVRLHASSRHRGAACAREAARGPERS